MHQCRESVGDGIKHLITLATGIFEGWGVRGKEGEKEAAGLRSSPWAGPVGFCSPVRVSQKAGQSSRSMTWGPFSQAPAAGELPAPAAVRRGWGGREEGRAGGRPERGVGQPEGGPAAPAAAHSLQTAPALGQRGAPRRQQHHSPRVCRGEPSSLRPDPGPHGSAARRGSRAGGKLASETIIIALRSMELLEDAA